MVQGKKKKRERGKRQITRNQGCTCAHLETGRFPSMLGVLNSKAYTISKEGVCNKI
jgi:hypothetical protein